MVSNLFIAYGALKDWTSIRILNLLFERECCICEIMQALDIPQKNASRNLNILRDAGFITQRDGGLWLLYSINREGKYFDYAVRAVKEIPTANEDLVSDIERLKVAKRIGVGKVEKLASQGCGFCVVCRPDCPQYNFRAEIMQEEKI